MELGTFVALGVMGSGMIENCSFNLGEFYVKMGKTNRELWRYSMEFISKEKIVELSNPGVVSRQLLNPENSSSERVTITEVHLEIGACQPRHTHDASEQIWYATKGAGKLLLADEQEKVFTAGDVVRFADKDVHGLLNDGNEEFVYVSVTAPPINFGYAYKDKK